MADIVTITADQDGQRIDRLLRQMGPHLRFAQVQKMIRSGEVRLDGKRVKADTRPDEGQALRLPPYFFNTDQPPKKTHHPDDIRAIEEMRVFEDDHILVLNKPAGLATQGGTGIKKHIDGMLEGYSDPKPRLVHRLDKETSGLLVLAKSAKVARSLGDIFKGRHVRKTYWAIGCGLPEQKDGIIDAPLKKITIKGNDTIIHAPEDGQKALSEFTVLDVMGDAACWLELSPLTGRTHQLRVHAALIGCPLLGDTKYNREPTDLSTLEGVYQGLHLHALRLEFNHPITGKPLTLQAQLPKTLEKSWASLGFSVVQI